MKKLMLAVGIGAVMALGACGSDESREDADDVPNGAIEKSEPNATAFNNKFPNVESKCLYAHEEVNVTGDGKPHDVGEGTGLRVVVNTDKRMLVIPDPHCPGFMPVQTGTQAIGGNAP